MTKASKLLILSSNFPYGNLGDSAFLKNEIDTLSVNFDSVFIVATNDECEKLPKLPKNVDSTQVNISKKSFGLILKTFFNMLSIEAIKEFFRAKLKFKQKGVLPILKGICKYYYAYNQLKCCIIKNCDSDTICYSYWLSTRAFALAKLKKKGKLCNKIISRSHGFDCFLSAGYQPFRAFMLEQIDEIYFVSEIGKNDFCDNYMSKCKKPLARLRVSRLGSNVESEIVKPTAAKALRIISCSRITQLKRLDRVIDALQKTDDILVEWTHYGAGELEEKIKNYASDMLGEKKNIKYTFMGQTSQEEIIKAYKSGAYDLFINSSETEGVPVSIMEAYAVGLPVVAYDVGGNSEIVEGEGYLLCENDGAEALQKAILRFSKLTKEEVEKRQKEVKEFSRKEYSMKNYDVFAKRIKEPKTIVTSSHLGQFEYANVDLEKDYGATNIINLYKPCNNIFTKVVRRVWYKINLPQKSVWYDKRFKQLITYAKKIIIFDSILGYEILKYMKRKSPADIHFWYWNIVGNTAKNLEKIRKYAKIWSFDKQDCKRYNLNFNHQFYGDKRVVKSQCENPKILFVGRDKSRLESLVKVADYCNANSIDYTMKVMSDKHFETNDKMQRITKFISYGEVFEMIEYASCLIDFLQEGQEGLTLRTLEGLFNGKKVITNNKGIVKEALFSKDSVLVLNDDLSNLEQVASFVINCNVSYDKDKLAGYTFDNWLKGFN